MGHGVPPGVSLSGSSGAPVSVPTSAASVSTATPNPFGPMCPRVALLPALPTAAAIVSTGAGVLGWITSYTRGRGRGYWRGEGGWSRGGYGGHRGGNHGGRGGGRGRGVRGWSAPYPTSVVRLLYVT